MLIQKDHLWFRIPLKYFFWQDALLHSLQKIITDSWFLTVHSLTFTQPVQYINSWLKLSTSVAYPPFILWKGLNHNPWWYTCDYAKQLTHVFLDRPFSSKLPISHLQKLCLVSFKTRFDRSSIFDSPTLSFKIFLPSDPHLVMRAGSWTTSHGLYLEAIMIWLDLFPANFQLTVTSSIWKNSLSFFLNRLNLLFSNFQMTMKLFSHSPVS